MTLMRKLLDAFNMNNWRLKEKPPVKNNTKYIREYAMELLLSGHQKGKSIGGGYITAYMYECNISNPEKLDYWLLHHGYLRKPTLEESLARYKVPELKEILQKRGLRTTGKKSELIQRLIDISDTSSITSLAKSDTRYFLSDKGLKWYYDNIDLYDLHRNWKYGIGINEYFQYRQLNGVNKNYYEIAYLILTDRIEIYSLYAEEPRKLSVFDFKHLSKICEELHLYEEAILHALTGLYLDTNLIDRNLFNFHKDTIELFGVDDMINRLKAEVIFNVHSIERICSLSQYYSTWMIDYIYENIKLRHTIFDKEQFESAVNDIINSDCFDPSPYMQAIRSNYIVIASHILHN